MSAVDHGQRYGHRHRAIRAALLGELRGGAPMTCSRCGKPLDPRAPDRALHLDHADDGGAAQYRGLAHARCNIAAPGVRGAAADAVARYGGDVAGPDPGPPAQCVGSADHGAYWQAGWVQSGRVVCLPEGGHSPRWVAELVGGSESEVEQPRRGFAY